MVGLLKKVSKKVEMYLNIQGKKLEDFVYQLEEGGEYYYTDQKVHPENDYSMLCIAQDGSNYEWIKVD